MRRVGYSGGQDEQQVVGEMEVSYAFLSSGGYMRCASIPYRKHRITGCRLKEKQQLEISEVRNESRDFTTYHGTWCTSIPQAILPASPKRGSAKGLF